MNLLEIQKTAVEGLLNLASRVLRPHPAFLGDPRVQALKETFETMRRLEGDPRMRARWETLERVALWLVSQDGAYRIRAIRLAQEVSRRRKAWKLRPWECRYWEGL